ncbi:MAG: putative diguanylate cyclase YegE [Smithella sp. PtaU1.Bin162]|nr:MAG: putative diguanylate cyclase YegE [Smithella sp. PtaU1.Bin162]
MPVSTKDNTVPGKNSAASSLPVPFRALPAWLMRRSTIVALAFGLFFLLVFIFLYLAARHLETAKNNAFKTDAVSINLISGLITNHENAVREFLLSYAWRTGFVQAVKKKDPEKLSPYFKEMKKNPYVDGLFIADKDGILWFNEPCFPESIGRNFSYRDWFKGVRGQWQPYVSAVFQRIVGEKSLAIVNAVPVFDEQGKPIGILGNSHNLLFINDIIAPVPLSAAARVDIVDRAGQIVYSNHIIYKEAGTFYPALPLIGKALHEKRIQLTIDDQKNYWARKYVSIASVDIIGGAVIVERTLKNILQEELIHLSDLAIVLFLFFLVVVLLLFFLRHNFILQGAESSLQAETRLRASEVKFKDMFESSMVGKSITSPDGRINVNSALCELLGYSRDELNRLQWQDITHPDDIALTAKALEPLYSGAADATRLIKRYRRKDGGVIWADVGITVRRDKEGKPVYFMTNMMDITDRRLLEEKSIRKSKMLQAINNIFYATMMAETEAAVAQSCLAEAVELTGSRFGFIGKVMPDGLFSTIALSDPGGKDCRIAEGVAVKMIDNMSIRGIWGDVILREQALIINDPPAYPGDVGLPPGHPPLISFLGAPLKDKGRTIGMIAVANSSPGYTEVHRQQLEALCVAFVEAIRRKQAEEAVQRANAELEERIAQRTKELADKNEELLRLNNVFVGRELRMRELKAKIAEREGAKEQE